MEHVILILASVLGATCFAVTMRVPPNCLLGTVSLGLLTSVSIRYLPWDIHEGFRTFVVSLGVGLLSHLFARTTRKPAQVFLIPGVIFMVPGTTIYKSFSAALQRNTSGAGDLFISAVITTFAISFGLLLATWLLRPRQSL